MVGLREKIRTELESLILQGIDICTKFNKTRNHDALSKYQMWYSRSIAVIRQLLPERLGEFVLLYEGKPIDPKKMAVAAQNYGICSYLLGSRVQTTEYHGAKPKDSFDHEAVLLMKVKQQLDILSSAESRLDDILSNIMGVLQEELCDSELGSARALLKTGHLRAAGTVAGVVLERHLSVAAKRHGVIMKKKNPTINDWNEAMRAENKIDLPTWRLIQWLGDIRNLCAHKKDREPKADEVGELIDGVDKITKTLL